METTSLMGEESRHSFWVSTFLCQFPPFHHCRRRRRRQDDDDDDDDGRGRPLLLLLLLLQTRFDLSRVDERSCSVDNIAASANVKRDDVSKEPRTTYRLMFVQYVRVCTYERRREREREYVLGWLKRRRCESKN